MCELSRRFEIHRPRTKYLDVEKANLTYMKQRKHSKSQQHKLTRRLIKLLAKILEEIRKMMREHDDEDQLTLREKSTLDIITKVYRQQKNHFNSNDPRESIPDRIVSISKLYVRPIVRGKEEENGDSVHLLRHPHSERGPLGRAIGRTRTSKGSIETTQTIKKWSPPQRTPYQWSPKVTKTSQK